MRHWFASGAVAMVLAVGGCTNQVPGGPTYSPPSPGPPVSSDATRRADTGIDLADFNPCSSITTEQAESMGLDGPKLQSSKGDAKTCNWTHFLSEPIESYLVDGSDRQGIESVSSGGSTFKIGRFEAVEARSGFTGGGKECAIAVSVRPGQVLLIAYIYSGTTQRMTHDLACQKVKPVAEMVVANLDRGGN